MGAGGIWMVTRQRGGLNVLPPPRNCEDCRWSRNYRDRRHCNALAAIRAWPNPTNTGPEVFLCGAQRAPGWLLARYLGLCGKGGRWFEGKDQYL